MFGSCVDDKNHILHPEILKLKGVQLHCPILRCLKVHKVVGDKLLSWVIMVCDPKILCLLLRFWLANMAIKSCMIILSLT